MSLGYEEQCRSMTPMPAMSLNVTSVAVPTDRVMLLLVAVNGPTVSAGDGTSIATPDDGMGDRYVEGNGSGGDRRRCRAGGIDRGRDGAVDRRQADGADLLHDGRGE